MTSELQTLTPSNLPSETCIRARNGKHIIQSLRHFLAYYPPPNCKDVSACQVKVFNISLIHVINKEELLLLPVIPDEG